MSIAPLTRRRFLSNLTLAAPASSRVVRAMTAFTATQLGFAGIDAPNDTGSDRIEVYRVNEDQWRLSSSVAAAAPRALVLHPTLAVLYVAHGIAEHQHRPRGAVSAFRIDTATASLSLLSHEPLTLGTTLPDRMAIAPDGHHLMVASTSAAILNLFPLRDDGTPTPTPSPLKLPGLSSPQFNIAFHGSSSVILAMTSSRVERLVIRQDSSLTRLNPSKGFYEDSSISDESSHTLNGKLAAHSAASLAMLTI
jgi:Lactonase, 7-bladed beta-propeller